MALPGFGAIGGGLGAAGNIARAGVRIVPDLKNFDAELASRVSTAATIAGAAAASAFAVTFAAGAAAAVGGAQAFAGLESSLAKIQGLVGISADGVGDLEQAILRIGPAVGKGPEELAEAMFFITSAGLRGQTAIEALEASAKAAAAGLGETADIADAVTSAINAYGEENLSASDAVDVLVGTIREGKLESSELAGVLGRVIPIASELGVEFGEVGASIAAMSRTGLDANEAVTALRGIFNTLLKPTSQAAALFDDFGTSTQAIRDTIRNEGLFAGLIDLRDVIGENEEAFAQVIPNVRALGGFLNLMGENADANAQIFENLTGETQFLEEAFGAAADTGAFKFQQALAEMQVELIEIGRNSLPQFVQLLQTLLPVIRNDLVPAITTAAELFVNLAVGVGEVIGFVSNLPGPVKTAATAVAGLAAAFAVLNLSAPVAAFTAIAGVISLIGRNAREQQERVEGFRDALAEVEGIKIGNPFEDIDASGLNVGDVSGVLAGNAEALAAINKEIGRNIISGGLIDTMARLGVSAADVQKAIIGGEEAITEFGRTIKTVPELRLVKAGFLTELFDINDALAEQINEYIDTADAASEYGVALERMSPAQKVVLQDLGLLETSAANTSADVVLLAKHGVDLAEALTTTGAASANAAADLILMRGAGQGADAATRGFAGAVDVGADTIGGFNPLLFGMQERAEKAAGAMGEARTAIEELTSAQLTALSPTLQLFDANDDLAAAQVALAEAEAEFGTNSEEHLRAVGNVLEAQGRLQAVQGAFNIGIQEAAEAILLLGDNATIELDTLNAFFAEAVGIPNFFTPDIEREYGAAGELIIDELTDPASGLADVLQTKGEESLLKGSLLFSTDAVVDIDVIPNFRFPPEFGKINFGDDLSPPPVEIPGGRRTDPRDTPLTDTRGFEQRRSIEINTTVNNPVGVPTEESVEEVILDPRLQRLVASQGGER